MAMYDDKGRPSLSGLKRSHGRDYTFKDTRSLVIQPDTRGVSSTIDCYVSGSYLDKYGKLTNAKLRFTVDIRYNKTNMAEVLADLRVQLVKEFKAKYESYDVTEVFIPSLSVPGEPDVKMLIQEQRFYYGSTLFKSLTAPQIPSGMRLSAEQQEKRLKKILNRRFRV